MRNATLRQLKVFECVARHLSFTRAAQELHLTQPAVSTQVKELEAHAGQRLFEQLGRKIYLTQAGEEMLQHSRAIIQQFREAAEAMHSLGGIAGGRLNVAVIGRMVSAEPAPKPAAVRPAARPRRSGNHLSALPTQVPYTAPAPMPLIAAAT